MAGKIGLFGYRAGNTCLHRMPSWLKLLCLIILSIAAYISMPSLAAALVAIIFASIAARIPPWALLTGIKPLIVLAFFILAMSAVELNPFAASAEGLLKGIIVVIRIIAVFTASALFFAVTTMRELRLSLGKIEAWFTRSKSIAYFSLGLCLMMGFIPRFFELWETASLAYKARSCKRGFRRLFILIPLVTEKLMEAAADTALALESRGLGSGTID